ncbi:major facilitator superfamily domain-containing protein [Rhodocollybia butyracea]|uniref:Major facilitator superfamily domain-containing protein n=1 Tax=Rhodocollybia butyracea TaxID=206335 RepID=A0A9P5PER2_9AGAR|nr:major facilitator superfamily domain-containing protein [Rhodocollybia butyracea]
MQSKSTPLPKLQIGITLIIQLAEPVTGMVIYPFITRAIRRSGITQGNERNIGYYAGIVQSIFFFSESLTVYYWGRASDFYGRRPILLIGPLGLALSVLAFGLCSTFWGMMICRSAMGIFNGNIGVSKTVMAEATDKTNRADAFTLMPLVWTIGMTAGPALGGILADPASRWPDIFGKFTFFQEYPWFLPCFTAGLLAFLAFLLSLWGLRETLSTKVKQTYTEAAPLLHGNAEISTSYGLLQPNVEASLPLQQSPPTALSLLGDPKLRITILSMGLLSFTDMCYEALIPIIYSTSISVGGLGFSPYQVGLIMGIFGLFDGIWNWVVLTRIIKRYGPRKTIILFYSFFLVHFALLWVLRDLTFYFGAVTPLVWALLVFQLFMSTVILTAFNAMHLLVVMSAPPNALGSVTGLAQVFSSGARGCAPLFASSLFSFSLQSRVAGGHLLEIVLIGVTIMGIYTLLRLPH